MAKVTRVNVRCPNGKLQIVNLSPNSSILQILEEVCRKEKLNPGDFDVCHYNKPLDLTLPVRFANLSNNAQLELQPVKVARKASLVTIGLQLESGERIMKDFVPSTSMWDVVEQCLDIGLDKNNLNEKGEPVCVYMRQTLVGKSLKETTLHGLGLTKGSAVIRFMYRNPEDLVDQAHSAVPLSKPKEASPTHSSLSADFSQSTRNKPVNESAQNFDISSKKHDKLESAEISPIVQKECSKKLESAEISPIVQKECSKNLSMLNTKEKIKEVCINKDFPSTDLKVGYKSGIVSQSNEVKNVSLQQNMELDSVPMDVDTLTEVEDIGAIHYIGGKHAVLYSLDDITDIKKADLPDEFFQLTVDDVKYLMEQFKKSRLDLENQPLLTKELRNRHLHQKLGRFKQTVIRIYFPERLVLQAVFEAQETVQDVCNFLRDYLEDKNVDFYLYTTPPKEKKDPSKTLIESMLIPAAVMYFGCDKQYSSYLLKSLREKISDPRAASLAAYESRKEAVSEIEDFPSVPPQDEITTYEADVDSYKVPASIVTQASSPIQTTEKVPKWFKMSKK